MACGGGGSGNKIIKRVIRRCLLCVFIPPSRAVLQPSLCTIIFTPGCGVRLDRFFSVYFSLLFTQTWPIARLYLITKADVREKKLCRRLRMKSKVVVAVFNENNELESGKRRNKETLMMMMISLQWEKMCSVYGGDGRSRWKRRKVKVLKQFLN